MIVCETCTLDIFGFTSLQHANYVNTFWNHASGIVWFVCFCVFSFVLQSGLQASAVLNGVIYVAGGFDGSYNLQSIEVCKRELLHCCSCSLQFVVLLVDCLV